MPTQPDLAAIPGTGLIDLEKELSCSICTDILYQPLTLLDCLHTFCGSCLKEWFGWQAQRARRERHDRNRHGASKTSYTCPSCRAVVRETRPNAQVTTLLDMYLTANPARRKNDEDKLEIARSYKHGERVLPEGRRESRRRSDEGHTSEEGETEDLDRRLVEEVREISLRDIRGDEPAGSNVPRERRAGGAARDGRRTRGGRTSAGIDSGDAARTEQDREARHNRAVNLGHQSSLRALLSPYNSVGMKEDIMKQIVEEGLLDDIDWDNIQPEQEDEISERIADAYRRRRRNRSPRRSRQPSQPRNDPVQREEPREAPRRESAPQTEAGLSDTTSAQTRATTARPPASRPHLLDAAAGERTLRHHRRSSSQGREQTLQPNNASYSSHAAARSATDLSERAPSRDPRQQAPRRASHESRRSTDPDGISISERWRRAAATSNVRDSAASPVAQQANAVAPRDQPLPARIDTSAVPNEQQIDLRNRDNPALQEASGSNAISVSCDRCGRADIHGSLHYSCDLCRPGAETYDLCLRCYRLGRGCLHWYGFGAAAGPRFERLAAPGSEPPHMLRGQEYVKMAPQGAREPAAVGSADREVGEQDRGIALETGVFCDACHANANSCYFHCAHCNDGEWGFCHRCVNSGRCCSHPLLPLALTVTTPANRDANTDQQEQAELVPLSLPTTCNACDATIAPSSPRLHCPMCSDGDYDLCLSCYQAWAHGGRISSADGLHGWRRCLQGHRMLIVQFDVGEGGAEWRRVVEGVVGGWSLPGEGGLLDRDGRISDQAKAEGRGWRWRERSSGMVAFKTDHRRGSAGAGQDAVSAQTRAQAMWSFWPAEERQDELGFPRGALIEEIVDVNGDFAWGVYARQGGVFPLPYVRTL